MANRQEKRAAAAEEKREASLPSVDEQHAALVAQMGGAGPVVNGVMTIEQAAEELGRCSDEIARLEKLNAQAQLEIEALQADRAKDRELIVELQGSPSVTKLSLTRDVLEDEIDEDPSESPGSAAYDGGFRAGMLKAAIICETQWSSDIGRHCAASIREAEEVLP